MPIYKFKCKFCDFIIEKLSIPNILQCEKCGSDMEKYYSPLPNIVKDTSSEYHGMKGKRNAKEQLERRSEQYKQEIAGELVEKHGYEVAKQTSVIKNRPKKI